MIPDAAVADSLVDPVVKKVADSVVIIQNEAFFKMILSYTTLYLLAHKIIDTSKTVNKILNVQKKIILPFRLKFSINKFQISKN